MPKSKGISRNRLDIYWDYDYTFAVFSVPAPITATIGGLSSGMLGTRQTVAKMVAMIRAAIKNSAVRTVALSIVQDVPERDTMAQVDAIFAWVQEHFSYVKDPVGVESLSRPEYMLRQIAEVGIARGDCDDVTMLLCALVGVLGIPSRVRVIQFAGYPGFSHVVAAVELAPGVYVEYDGTKRAGMVSALPVIGRAETETIIP